MAVTWAFDVDGGQSPPDLGPYVGPTPDRSFVWLAKSDGTFTDVEISQLTTSFSYVVIARAHAGGDVDLQLDDIRRIKRADPRVKVFLYVNVSYWYDTNDTPSGWGTRYDHSWSLPDRTAPGRLMRFKGAAEREIADFIDLGNANYRSYLLGLLRTWVAEAPVDGIAFDSAHPVYPDVPVAGRRDVVWGDLLSAERIYAHNAGLVDLLRRTKRILGPERSVLYNGIADSPILVSRNLGLLDESDIAVDEEFCLDQYGIPDPAKLRVDLELMEGIAGRGKMVMEKVNIDQVSSSSDIERLGRYCSGAFFLGWQPGSSLFKFGPGYSETEISSDPEVARLSLGEPLGNYREQGGMASREFQNGTVFVNLSDEPRRVWSSRAGALITENSVEPVEIDDEISVRSLDAAFVVTRP